MSSFLLAALAVFACSLAQAYGESTLTITPSHTLMVVGDEYKIQCNASEPSLAGVDVLTLQVNTGEVFKIPIAAISEKTPSAGFVYSNYGHKANNEGGMSQVSISITVKVSEKGKFVVNCRDKSKSFYAVDAERTSTKEALSCKFTIPRNFVSELGSALDDETKTQIHLVGPANAALDLQEVDRNCTTSSDAKDLRYCFKFSPKAGSIASGRYHFELRSTSGVIIAATQDVSSNKLEIKDCASTAGSNCIADSEFCTFKCKVVGWPFTNCKVSGLGGLPESNTRMTVDCLYNDQFVKIVLTKPTQDDSGLYNVTAIGGSENLPAEGQLQIRVKDKLAPLWPFLGICAEVVILCGIILFFEKRHQKKLQQQENEGGEASEAMVKKAGGDVRQRGAAKA